MLDLLLLILAFGAGFFIGVYMATSNLLGLVNKYKSIYKSYEELIEVLRARLKKYED